MIMRFPQSIFKTTPVFERFQHSKNETFGCLQQTHQRLGQLHLRRSANRSVRVDLIDDPSGVHLPWSENADAVGRLVGWQIPPPSQRPVGNSLSKSEVVQK